MEDKNINETVTEESAPECECEVKEEKKDKNISKFIFNFSI